MVGCLSDWLVGWLVGISGVHWFVLGMSDLCLICWSCACPGATRVRVSSEAAAGKGGHTPRVSVSNLFVIVVDHQRTTSLIGSDFVRTYDSKLRATIKILLAFYPILPRPLVRGPVCSRTLDGGRGPRLSGMTKLMSSHRLSKVSFNNSLHK